MKALIFITVLMTATLVTTAQNTDSLQRTSFSNKKIKEVVISGNTHRQQQHINSTQMGKVDLPLDLMMKAPAIGGERDIIKSLQLTPGVKRGTEGGIGMYVRGGGNDENLILLDGAPVYNAGHLLGFFSVFNSTVVRDVQLYKSSFPVEYGGRLSSVMDVRTKDGSLTEHHPEATLGLISSNIGYSGPLVKDKLSVSVAGRRTYIDKILKYIPYNFYDLNARFTYVLNGNNRITLSGYKGDDVLKLQRETKDSVTGLTEQLRTGMKLGNTTLSSHWLRNSKNDRLSSDVSVYYTSFRYDINGSWGENKLLTSSAIQDMGIKASLKYQLNETHKLGGGASFANHYFNPNIVQGDGRTLEEIDNSNGEKIYNNEMAVFVNDELKLSDRTLLNAGMRLSAAQAANKWYYNAEPRLALRYRLADHHAIKMSYARMAQYMHLVSSSSVNMPTDLWYPVTANIQPGISDQVSIGYYRTVPSLNLTLSAEAYYKWLDHLVEYKEGAQLMLNNNYEQELLHGKGRSYGIELLASRTSGRLTGWVGYALSYAKRQFDSLNKGNEYFARYDRRHDFSLVAACDLNKKIAFSTSLLYATGNPFTGQTGQYLLPNPGYTGIEVLPTYTSRNELRFSSSFRIDFDVQYKFSFGAKLKAEAHFSVYNVLNRTQPGRIERNYNELKKEFAYQQKGLFGMIPAASINFKL